MLGGELLLQLLYDGVSYGEVFLQVLDFMSGFIGFFGFVDELVGPESVRRRSGQLIQPPCDSTIIQRQASPDLPTCLNARYHWI